MRKTLLALMFAGAAPVAIAPAPSWALVGAVPVAKPAGAGSALMRIDSYLPRQHYRGYRSGYYRGPAYFAGARAYYAAPAYAPPPVVYYPPVILYYPPPVVAYPAPVAPYLYGARRRHLPTTAPIRTGDGEEVQLLGASSLRVRFSNSRRNSSFLKIWSKVGASSFCRASKEAAESFIRLRS